MSVEDLTGFCKTSSSDSKGDSELRQVADRVVEMGVELRNLVTMASQEGRSFDSTERAVWRMVLQAGYQALELFIRLQGAGDLGSGVITGDGRSLYRSEDPGPTTVRSIFGDHEFQQYTYSAGTNKKIELRPVSARMQLPEHRWTCFLQEFSQLFCVDEAFRQAARNLESILGLPFSVDTLEQTSQRMGRDADTFLDSLPVPRPDSEAELLVISADCKGVPLVKADAARVAAFETAKKRPGNRRMATVTSAYTVDRHMRRPEHIVAALFREDTEPTTKSSASEPRRPKPQNKHTSAHFPTTVLDGDTDVPISGIHEGMAWLAAQVESRRQADQPLIVLMDGQPSLWDVAEMHFGNAPLVIPILDIIHVSTYVWEAAALFHASADERKAFTRDRLLKILRGEVKGVVRGLRRMGSLAKLGNDKRRDLERICGYFEKHQHRMRYNEYLSAGYPIASGVIEGACGHLVKDRMERSGMRWTLEGARCMLNVRAVFQSDYWNKFCVNRAAALGERAHPHRDLLGDYTPLTLAP